MPDGHGRACHGRLPPATGRIAFDDFVTGQIYAVNPDGTGLAQLTHEPKKFTAQWPAWSPNGSRILFVRLNPSNGMGRIWIMNANGTSQRQLASDAPGYRDYQPSYAPDSKHIVFSRCAPDEGLCAIWIMRSDGTHRRLVVPSIEAPNETGNFDPKVSPDGRQITFTRFGFKGVISQVWVVRIDGTHAHPLTAPRLEASGPSWAPDSKHIAFVSNSGRPQASLFVMRIQRYRSHQARHDEMADQQLRARLRAWRRPDRVLERPAASRPVLRGALPDACRRLPAAPGTHRPSRRRQRRLGHRALIVSTVTGAAGGACPGAMSPRRGRGWRPR